LNSTNKTKNYLFRSIYFSAKQGNISQLLFFSSTTLVLRLSISFLRAFSLSDHRNSYQISHLFNAFSTTYIFFQIIIIPVLLTMVKFINNIFQFISIKKSSVSWLFVSSPHVPNGSVVLESFLKQLVIVLDVKQFVPSRISAWILRFS